ncbi:hypothetical protein MPS_5488 [Mycobacterium pseudoshottsii JCM 15466]|nr:hypothetical protein MPS_5488 [Mycobacterium pseudoshottsii JCM 15466]
MHRGQRSDRAGTHRDQKVADVRAGAGDNLAGQTGAGRGQQRGGDPSDPDGNHGRYRYQRQSTQQPVSPSHDQAGGYPHDRGHQGGDHHRTDDDGRGIL